MRPRSTQGSRPTECRSTAGGQQRSKKPQPEHFDMPTVSCGASSARRTRRIRSRVASAVLGALVGDVDDLAGAVVDLEGDRRLAEGLLVEPAVGGELERDLRVGAVADPAGELRVADRVAAAGGEEEVGDADDLDRGAGERRSRRGGRPGR